MQLFKDKMFFHIENLDEIETMALMSLCKGAAYEKRNPVFVPKKWISFKKDTSDLFPKEWKQI